MLKIFILEGKHPRKQGINSDSDINYMLVVKISAYLDLEQNA
jgi:hypothetical protein